MSKPAYASERIPAGRRRVGTAWRKSSYSLPEGACIEITLAPTGQVLFRDSKIQGGPVMAVSRESAAAFTAAVDRGTV